jgi:hypothetical protein
MGILDKLFGKKEVDDNETVLDGPISIQISNVLAVALIVDSPEIDFGANEENFFWTNYNYMNPGLMAQNTSIRWHLARLGREIPRKEGVLLSDFLSSDLNNGLEDTTVFVQAGRVNFTTFDSSVQNVKAHIMTFVKPMSNFKRISILDIAPGQFSFV